MKPLRIYVDFDDVVAETARHLAHRLFLDTGRRVAYADIAFFDLRRSFALGACDYAAFMARAHAPEVLAALPETRGACRTLRAWLDCGLAPAIVTGRPPASHAATRAWLDRRGLPDLPVLHVDKYNRALGAPAPEVPVLRFGELGAHAFDLAIDDAPPALDLLAGSGLCPFVVFDRPWNRDYTTSGGGAVPRVADWTELDRLVRAAAA